MSVCTLSYRVMFLMTVAWLKQRCADHVLALRCCVSWYTRVLISKQCAWPFSRKSGLHQSGRECTIPPDLTAALTSWTQHQCECLVQQSKILKKIPVCFFLRNSCLVCFGGVNFCFSDLMYFFCLFFLVIVSSRSNNLWTHRAAASFRHCTHTHAWLWSAASWQQRVHGRNFHSSHACLFKPWFLHSDLQDQDW